MDGRIPGLTSKSIVLIKALLKNLIKKLPFAFTLNQKYDGYTQQIIKRYCEPGSNCIDVGTHKGEILDLILKAAPNGKHFGFEPIPVLYEELKKKYSRNQNVFIHPYALSDKKGLSNFNYVLSNPAYSGLVKRKYDRKHEDDVLIEVETERLDAIVDISLPLTLIKIDVEGGELGVLKGAESILKKHPPIIIFECGKSGSSFYGTTPEMIYSFLQQMGYSIYLMDDFLNGKPALTDKEFGRQFSEELNYYFVAGADRNISTKL